MELLRNKLFLSIMFVVGVVILLLVFNSDNFSLLTNIFLWIGLIVKGTSFILFTNNIVKKNNKFVVLLLSEIVLAIVLIIIAAITAAISSTGDSFMGGIWFFLLPYFIIVSIINVGTIIAK